MKWTVKVNKRAAKQLFKLPKRIKERFDLLTKEMEVAGPIRRNWKNFSRIKGAKNETLYHCHIKSGRPTYVACWNVTNKKIKLLEVYYVGTHEKTPY